MILEFTTFFRLLYFMEDTWFGLVSISCKNRIWIRFHCYYKVRSGSGSDDGPVHPLVEGVVGGAPGHGYVLVHVQLQQQLLLSAGKQYIILKQKRYRGSKSTPSKATESEQTEPTFSDL